MAEMTREQFVDRVIEQVREKFPLVKLARGDEPFSLRVNGNVVALENLYRMVQIRPDEMKRQVERWVVELIRAGEGTPDMVAGFDEIKDRILPMVLSSQDAKREQSVVSQSL